MGTERNGRSAPRLAGFVRVRMRHCTSRAALACAECGACRGRGRIHIGYLRVHVGVAARPDRPEEVEAHANILGPEGCEVTNRGKDRGREKQRTLRGMEGEVASSKAHPSYALDAVALRPRRPARPPVAVPRTGGGGHAARALGRVRVRRPLVGPEPLRRGEGRRRLMARPRCRRLCGGRKGAGGYCSN